MWPPVWDYRKSLEARKGKSTVSSRPSAESDSRPLTLTRTLWATRLLFKVTKLGTSLVVRGCDSTLLCRAHPWLVSEDSTCLWPRQQQCKQQKWHCQKFRFAYEVTSAKPDCVRAHGLYPARLLRPRDSPGKNTRVGCHALLRGTFPAGDRTLTSHLSTLRCHQCHLGSPTDSTKT